MVLKECISGHISAQLVVNCAGFCAVALIGQAIVLFKTLVEKRCPTCYLHLNYDANSVPGNYTCDIR